MALKSQLLLRKLAFISKAEFSKFSKEEIRMRINEIKYLSAQKKIPKLTLRKEIVHLENQLKGVYELEKAFLQRKKSESKQVTALKKEVTGLRRKLAATTDHDLQKKVDKLTYLLGEVLAKKTVSEDVELSQRITAELKLQPPKSEVIGNQKKLQQIYSRLSALKQELLVHADENPEKSRLLKEKVVELEEKLKGYEASSEVKVQHKILFSSLGPENNNEEDHKIDLEVEKELPLVPPPRIIREEKPVDKLVMVKGKVYEDEKL